MANAQEDSQQNPNKQATTANALEVENIRKRFGKGKNAIQAVAGISFRVPRESVYCILGPNGAGKTTLLRILTTLMRPDEGTARIEGFDIIHQSIQVRSLIGVVNQENQFVRYLSVWQNLMLHAEMHGMPKQEAEAEITRLLKKVDLYHRRMDSSDTFSGGMKRRISVIRALIHRPKVLFLDEPTTGLDPKARREVWDTIQEFKKSATIILTTHYMEEADYLSDNILMINHGRKVMEGTARELKRAISPRNLYELELATPKAQEYQSFLASHQAKDIEILNNHLLRFHLKDPAALGKITPKIPPEDFYRLGHVEEDLETVYLTVASQQADQKAQEESHP